MTEITSRVKNKTNEFNRKFDKIIIASQGLYLLIKDEGNKQFNELVIAGETKKAEDSNNNSNKDARLRRKQLIGSISNIRSASLGLIAKTKESSEQMFKELVEKGQPR